MLEWVLLLLVLVLTLKAPGFMTAENLLNILRNVSIQGLIALGMTMVIVAGEIDYERIRHRAFPGMVQLSGQRLYPASVVA